MFPYNVQARQTHTLLGAMGGDWEADAMITSIDMHAYGYNNSKHAYADVWMCACMCVLRAHMCM
jgi:hypothetical protein